MNPLDESLLRIPNPDYLTSYIETLNQLYQCVRNEACPESSPKQSKPLFIDTYREATELMLKRMDFPASQSYERYPISSEDPTLELSGPEIYTKNTLTLFGIAEEISADCSTEDKTKLFSYLNNAIYMARRAGFSDAEIQSNLDVVEDNLEACLITTAQPPALNETRVETPPPSPDSPLKAIIGVGLGFYPQYTAFNGSLYGGLKYYSNPARNHFIESGLGLAGARSIIENKNNNNLSAQAPYYYLAGGIALSKHLELFANTQWGVINQRRITYYGESNEPVIKNGLTLDVDVSLGLLYRGFGIYVGGHTSRGFYGGLGYEQSFNISSKQ